MIAGPDLAPRIASAIVLGTVAVLAAWWGGIAMAVLVTLAAAIVHLEWTGITEGSQPAAIAFTGCVAVTVFVAGIGHIEVAAIVGCLLAVIAVVAGPRPWRPAGVVYASAFGLSLLALRDSADGLAAIGFLFAVVWGTDIGAYFAGRAIGGPKLWPAVSPKKTWSGAIGGLCTAVVAGLAVAWGVGVPVGLALVVVALVLSIAGQFGDLFESFVKRHFGVKDSGSIIPGHGGLMDRVDALIFAGVVAVLTGMIHSGGTDAARGLIRW
ncbi:MAG: phosphatidate cytidylyltransferase [Bauldia sp.]|nr:phosphatidate cytidylyltransferase [Bauldia sp.]